MATRLFECSECGAFGKITLKGNEHEKEEIVYCPVCSADIYEDEKFEDEDEE
jgi:DNA-directed RNA polymerase subunit RPC12/RpoP